MLRRLKEIYWDYSNKRDVDARLALDENRAFSDYVQGERQRVLSAATALGVPNQIDKRLESAVAWLLRAQAASPDKGVAQGYFPATTDGGWRASYPETTGYIISTLLSYARQADRDDVADAALAMADWEIAVQMDSGAVQGGLVCAPAQQTAAAFNTGMVADGWVSAFEYSGQQEYLDAALRAARFLAQDLDERGFFRTNGRYVSANEVKTYTCLCAWAMYRAGLAGGDNALVQAAQRAVSAAVEQRNDVGWLSNNDLNLSDIPLTHTIGYALQGIFEVAVLAGRDDYIEAVRQSLHGALSSMHDNGYLSARLDHNWRPRAEYVCLTGSVQLAIVCFRFAEQFGDDQFVDRGNRLLGFTKATQLLEFEDADMVGAIPGSFPIMGEYMKGGYPNWATKYFIDALLLQKKLHAGN